MSLVSDTSQPPTLCRPPIWQGGREMSAPRPYEPSPLHPLALFTPYAKINFYIYTNRLQLLLSCGNCIVSPNIVYLYIPRALFQNHIFQNSVLFCSPLMHIGTTKASHRSSTQMHRNIALIRQSANLSKKIVQKFT